MMVKPCTLSWRIIKLKALKGRFPNNQPLWPSIAMEYTNRVNGYKGEKSLDFYLDQLSQTKYEIYHDLRLFDGKYYFQIDTFVQCTGFQLVIESKNRRGEIKFERGFQQTTLKINNHTKRIANPVLQAKQQALKLKKWLQEHNCKELPTRFLFVNSKEETLIVADPDHELAPHIVNSEGLLEKISQMANYYKENNIDKKDLRKIKNLLLTNHTPDNPDILQEFHVNPKNILPGVRCPQCKTLSMYYRDGKWHCQDCNTTSKDAHEQAIYEYFLLINPSITNSELRKFLQLQSRKVAHKLLTSMKLPFTGEKKSRIYHQPPLEHFHELLSEKIDLEDA